MSNAEIKVRGLLAKEFGVSFNETKLPVGKTIEGYPAFKKFDAVSIDTKIVAMVKDCSANNIEGNQTRHARVVRDLYYLNLVSATKKLMFLSPDYYNWFRKQPDAAVPSSIDVRTIPL